MNLGGLKRTFKSTLMSQGDIKPYQSAIELRVRWLRVNHRSVAKAVNVIFHQKLLANYFILLRSGLNTLSQRSRCFNTTWKTTTILCSVESKLAPITCYENDDTLNHLVRESRACETKRTQITNVYRCGKESIFVLYLVRADMCVLRQTPTCIQSRAYVLRHYNLKDRNVNT